MYTTCFFLFSFLHTTLFYFIILKHLSDSTLSFFRRTLSNGIYEDAFTEFFFKSCLKVQLFLGTRHSAIYNDIHVIYESFNFSSTNGLVHFLRAVIEYFSKLNLSREIWMVIIYIYQIIYPDTEQVNWLLVA